MTMTEQQRKAVSSVEAMEAHVNDWCEGVKGKQRGIFSFDQLCNNKLQQLKNAFSLMWNLL